MTDRGALLAAVRATPGDDLPRLVFADWLEENGEAGRAAAIRAMCRFPHEFDAEVQTERAGLGGVPPAAPAVVRPALDWLESTAPADLSRLLGGRRCECVPGDYVWVQWCPKLALTAEWRRGFIARVQGPLDALRAHLPRLVREHPVERAEATDRRSDTDNAKRWNWFMDEAYDTIPSDRRLAPNWLPWALKKWFPPRDFIVPYNGFRRFHWNFTAAGDAVHRLSEALLAEARDRVAADGRP